MPDESSAPANGICPWCSAVVPAGAETCGSCGAALVSTTEGGVPGLTSIDEAAALRRVSVAKPRAGLLGFLSGETGDTVEAPSQAELSSIAPPGADVRIEMMRLELEAERQRLESEAAHLAAEAATESGASSLPPGLLAESGPGAVAGASPDDPAAVQADPAPTAAAPPPGPATTAAPPPPGPGQ